MYLCGTIEMLLRPGYLAIPHPVVGKVNVPTFISMDKAELESDESIWNQHIGF